MLSAKDWIWIELDKNVTSFSSLMSGFCHIMQSKKMRPDLDLKYFFDKYIVFVTWVYLRRARCSLLTAGWDSWLSLSRLNPVTINHPPALIIITITAISTSQ